MEETDPGRAAGDGGQARGGRAPPIARGRTGAKASKGEARDGPGRGCPQRSARRPPTGDGGPSPPTAWPGRSPASAVDPARAVGQHHGTASSVVGTSTVLSPPPRSPRAKAGTLSGLGPDADERPPRRGPSPTEARRARVRDRGPRPREVDEEVEPPARASPAQGRQRGTDRGGPRDAEAQTAEPPRHGRRGDSASRSREIALGRRATPRPACPRARRRASARAAGARPASARRLRKREAPGADPRRPWRVRQGPRERASTAIART